MTAEDAWSTEPVGIRLEERERLVGWTSADAARIAHVAAVCSAHLDALSTDFCQTVREHSALASLLPNDPRILERLRAGVLHWLQRLLSGPYDESYVRSRSQLGRRHAEVGVPPIDTMAAATRLRTGLEAMIVRGLDATPDELALALASLNRRIDLDLTIIVEAYEDERRVRHERNERLITLGQLSGGIVHELRNPLNAIKTAAEFLTVAGDEAGEERGRQLEAIRRQADLADQVIHALCDVVRLPVPRARPVDLPALLRRCVEADPPPTGIDVQHLLDETLPAIAADPDQLRIVLRNLIRNAYDAMPAGGRLTLKATRSGPYADLEVSDTGVGIPAPMIDQVLEPLVTTKPQGLGLGLAIVRSILDRCRGVLEVTSVPGEGTTFHVRLPIAPAGTTGPPVS
jgi:signal transduction histidine kinase